MNFRRGFNRLFLVLTIAYYGVGGLSLYFDWGHKIDVYHGDLNRCLDLARDAGDARITVASCHQAWKPPSVTTDELVLVSLFVSVPWVLYGLAEIGVWIGEGFHR
jgi:hypothetical protein